MATTLSLLADSRSIVSTPQPIQKPMPIRGDLAWFANRWRMEHTRHAQAKHVNVSRSRRTFVLAQPQTQTSIRRASNLPAVGGINPFSVGGDVAGSNAVPGGLPAFGRSRIGGGLPTMKTHFATRVARPIHESPTTPKLSLLEAVSPDSGMSAPDMFSSGSLSDLNLTEAQPGTAPESTSKNGDWLPIAALLGSLFLL